MLDTTIKALDGIARLSLDRGEWDETPMLALVTDKEEVIFMLLAGAGELHQILADLTEKMRDNLFPRDVILRGGNLTGLVLMSEGFKLSAPKDEVNTLEAEFEAIKEMGMRVSDSPDAIEIKIFHAVDVEGVAMRSFDRGATEVNDGSEVIGGRIVERMTDLYALASTL